MALYYAHEHICACVLCRKLVEVCFISSLNHFLRCVGMGPILFICAVFLVCSCQIKGSSAVTPVFVLKGNDLLLEIMEADVPEDFSLLLWRFNKNNVLVRFSPGKEPIVSNLYTGRVEASVKNFSVKLKNLQESDSGVYIARVTGDQEQILSEYKVTVQDPVSPVELTVDSVSNSSDSCNLTVTCSTQDSHHININSTFTCDNQTCIQEGGERSKVTTSGASLHVYLVNDLIICNHSNQVSWKNYTKQTEHICVMNDFATAHVHVPALVTVLVFIGAAVGVGVGAAVRHRKKGKYEREDTENTVYSPVAETGQRVNQSPTNDASGPSPTSTYCLVGSPTGPTRATEDRAQTLPDSPYAEVDAAQPLEQSPTNVASGPTSTYCLVGPHTRPTETRGKTPPESVYAEVDKTSRA